VGRSGSPDVFRLLRTSDGSRSVSGVDLPRGILLRAVLCQEDKDLRCCSTDSPEEQIHLTVEGKLSRDCLL
jgi:hypothetical protein